MAEKQAGGLSLRIGLTLNQLQSDFLAAEQTVKQGMAALNRQQNLIRIKTETDLAGLDALADKTKIIEVQERALTQLLDMQRDKLTLATKAYQDYASSKNANEVVAKKLETAMERERLAVAKLEAQLKNLSAQKVTIDTSRLQESIAKINSKIQHIKIQAEIDTSKLSGANAAFDAQKIHIAAVTKELELQRQKLTQLQAAMYQSAQVNGSGSSQTLNIKTNVLQQIGEINKLETKLKELQHTRIDLQFRTDLMRQAEQQIHDNIARINARIEHIRIKTDIDLSRLGEATSAFDKAKAHVQGLNQELTLQNQKLAELKKSLSTSIGTNGLNNVKTINLQTEIQQQIHTIDQLKAKINELNHIAPPKTNSLLSGYLNIKGNLTSRINELSGALTSLQGATSSADMAVISLLDVIGRIPAPVGAAVAALVGIPLAFKVIEDSIVDLSKAAAASGDAVYVMSRGMQMSVSDAAKFSTNAKVAGAQVNDLAMAVKNVQRQVARGGEDSRAAEWLKRYGESAYDASGNLKDLNQMTFALSAALKRAQADGKGAEFVLNVFRNVSADAITAIEDWVSVNEQASSIVKAGLANPTLAHELQGNLNALNVQTGQLNQSFTNALMPVANEIVPLLTDRIGKMTQVISDNKDFILELGKDFAKVWSGVETVVEAVGRGVAAIGGVAKNIYMTPKKVTQDLVDEYINDSEIKNAEDLLKKELMKRLPQERAAIYSSTYLYDLELRKYEPIAKAIEDAREKIAEEKKALEKELYSVADFSSASADRVKFEQNTELSKQAESIKKILQEASDIQYKLSHTDYENKKLDLLQWRQDMLNQAGTAEEQRVAIEKLYLAKLDKLNQEVTQKIAEHWKNAADIEYEMTHTAFEKQIRDIEQWKKAQLEKRAVGEETADILAEAAAKEAQAFEREMDRIKGTIQSLEDKIFEQEHSRYENDMRRVQQQRLKYYEEYQSKGILNADTQAIIERWFSNEIGSLNKRAAESRKSDGDYTKAPDGVRQSGGNGIMVIEGDQIIDNGLIYAQQREISLLADENQIRSALKQNLDANTRAEIEKLEATKALTAAQQNLLQSTQQTGNGIQIIEGDEIVSMPTAEIQQFGDAVQQSTAQLQQADPIQALNEATQSAADAHKAFADGVKDFPPEYFKNLADNAKAVSEMQGLLTESTMKLIDAQKDLSAALSNLPKGKSLQETTSNQGTNGLMNLSTQRQVSDIPQRDNGMKFGFDWDVFGGLASLAALIPHPAAKALAMGGAIGIGAGVGTFNSDSSQLAQSPAMNLETIVTPLNNIHTVVGNILSAMGDRQPPNITVSPNISVNLGGAYVFDNAMKTELTNDITQDIVDEITSTVQQATRQADYSYRA